ncbi:MAG: polysaccharide deacetylase family protein [Demequina sp.]
MRRQRGTLVVRRREIDAYPRPIGGTFGERPLVPVALPDALVGAFGAYCVNTSQKVVMVTYDDGPHPRDTPAILDVLADFRAPATFFVLAREARAHPGIVRRMEAEGHEVALHGEEHRSLLTMSAAGAARMVRAARRDVERIAGTRVRVYRPPYGHHSTAQALLLSGMGLRVVLWSGDAQDWVDGDPAEISRLGRDAAFPGCMLLLHDNRGDPETLQPGQSLPTFDRAEVTSAILDGLIADGYRFATVSQAMREFQPVRSMARQRMRGL